LDVEGSGDAPLLAEEHSYGEVGTHDRQQCFALLFGNRRKRLMIHFCVGYLILAY
jgi:hypothetical protein